MNPQMNWCFCVLRIDRQLPVYNLSSKEFPSNVYEFAEKMTIAFLSEFLNKQESLLDG